jgi:hypothetical protein
MTVKRGIRVPRRPTATSKAKNGKIRARRLINLTKPVHNPCGMLRGCTQGTRSRALAYGFRYLKINEIDARPVLGRITAGFGRNVA